MIMQTRQRQAGSIGAFVVVGMVFAAMLVGGIVLVKKRTSQPAVSTQNPDVTKVATQSSGASGAQSASQQNDEDRLAKEKKAAEEKARQEVAEREAKQKDEAEAAARRAEEARIAKEKAAEAAKAAQAQSSPATPDGPMTRTHESQAGALPTTGPVEDMLMMVIGAIVIVGAGYVYYHYGYGRN